MRYWAFIGLLSALAVSGCADGSLEPTRQSAEPIRQSAQSRRDGDVGRVITPWERDVFDLPAILGFFNFQQSDPPAGGACADGDRRPWVNTKTRRIFHCEAIEVRHEWTDGVPLETGTLWPAGAR